MDFDLWFQSSSLAYWMLYLVIRGSNARKGSARVCVCVYVHACHSVCVCVCGGKNGILPEMIKSCGS